MISIRTLTFNLFGTNTYVLYDETGECILIDPACSKPSEEEELSKFIHSKNLTPVAQIATHYHIDHVLGMKFVKSKYGLAPTAHPDGKIFWENSSRVGSEYGFNGDLVIAPDFFINEGDVVKFGNSELRILDTPGHAAGSVCLVNDDQRFVIAGDVLFYGSIGRTDLPTGDFDLLLDSIKNKLFTLNDNFIVYPGHGQKTTIGMERLHNPFFR